jgi:hypothetical protein
MFLLAGGTRVPCCPPTLKLVTRKLWVRPPKLVILPEIFEKSNTLKRSNPSVTLLYLLYWYSLSNPLPKSTKVDFSNIFGT